MSNSTQSPAFEQLLTSVSARFGIARADIEAHLTQPISFHSDFGPLNEFSLNTVVNGHHINLWPGRSGRCSDCTRTEEQRRGLAPGSLTQPVVCAAAAAAMVQYIISKAPAKYARPVEEPRPAPLTPAQEEAAGLASQYPELADRIARALELVETDAGHPYHTEWHNLTAAGLWTCDCPDATHRDPRFSGGVACKHALAGEIKARVQRAANRVAQQRLASKVEAAAVRNDYASPASYSQPADPINRKASHVYQFGKHRVK